MGSLVLPRYKAIHHCSQNSVTVVFKVFKSVNVLPILRTYTYDIFQLRYIEFVSFSSSTNSVLRSS